MTHYSTLNVKLSKSQFNKLKSRMKSGTEVPLKLSSNVIGNFNDEYNFQRQLLLTNKHVLRLCKTFAINLSADMKLSKTQLHKTGQSGGFLGRRLGPLLRNGLPLMKTVFNPLAKSVLIPLELTAAASATVAAIEK